MENPIKMDDLGVPLFLETPKCPAEISSSLNRTPRNNAPKATSKGKLRTTLANWARNLKGYKGYNQGIKYPI